MLAEVTPAVQGTHWFDRENNLQYTIGHEYVKTALDRLIRKGSVAVDIETAGLGAKARDIKCVTFANTSEAVILDPRHPQQAAWIRSGIQNARRLVFHNSAYDVPNLVLNKLMEVHDCEKVVDTLLYARMAEPDQLTKKDLNSLDVRYLHTTPGEDAMKKAFRNLGFTITEGWQRFDLDRPLYIHGSAYDTVLTAQLEDKLAVAAHNQLVCDHPFTRVGLSHDEANALIEREQAINRLFLQRSARGIRIDEAYLHLTQQRWEDERNQAVQLLEEAGVGHSKAAQLIAYLESTGNLPDTHPRTPTGKPSTTAAHLDQLNHPVAGAYKRVKQIDKVLKDYLGKCSELSVNGRVHPEVNLLAATTGRMSMGNPPFQQYSSDARGMVLADEGDSLTSIDWSQIEPVIAANLSQDHNVLAGYEAGTSDLYTDIATSAEVSRKQAKVILLALLYGEGIIKLAVQLGTDIDHARALRASIFRAMPKISNLINRMKRIAQDHKKVFTLSGRILPIPTQGQYGVHVHKGMNYLIQGSAYDVLAESLVEIKRQGYGDHVYLAMHDELIVSTEAAPDIRRIMETPPARLIELSMRTPVLRTDMHHMGERWTEV